MPWVFIPDRWEDRNRPPAGSNYPEYQCKWCNNKTQAAVGSPAYEKGTCLTCVDVTGGTTEECKQHGTYAVLISGSKLIGACKQCHLQTQQSKQGNGGCSVLLFVVGSLCWLLVIA